MRGETGLLLSFLKQVLAEFTMMTRNNKILDVFIETNKQKKQHQHQAFMCNSQSLLGNNLSMILNLQLFKKDCTHPVSFLNFQQECSRQITWRVKIVEFNSYQVKNLEVLSKQALTEAKSCSHCSQSICSVPAFHSFQFTSFQ